MANCSGPAPELKTKQAEKPKLELLYTPLHITEMRAALKNFSLEMAEIEY